MKTFLHIGCGQLRKNQTTQEFAKPQWDEVRVDIDPTVRPDVLGSMTDMGVVQSESADAIFSSHNIEHLYAHEVPIALAEFFRVLKDDGYAVITCPDLRSICKLVAEDKLTDVAYQSSLGPIAPIDMLFGHRPAIELGNHFMAHRCGFTERHLVESLKNAGFQSIASLTYPHRFDIWVIATKRQCAEDKLRILAENHFPKH